MLGVFELSHETSSTGGAATGVDTTVASEMASTGEASTGSDESTGESLECLVDERFEGGLMEPGWEAFGSLPLEHDEAMLRIVLVEAEGLNVGGVSRSDSFEPSVVTVALGSVPNPDSSAALQVELSSAAEVTVLLKITGGRISLYVLEGADVTPLGVDAPHDVAEHDQVRFVLEPTTMAVERSAGVGWESLWSGPSPLSLASGELSSSLSGRTTELTSEPGSVAFDAFSICPLP
jgi:hypothetical protein